MLLSFPGIIVNIKNNDKNTPLHYFCQKFSAPVECQEIFEKLIQGVDVNAQNRNGEAPLHKAIFNNHIKLLLVRKNSKAQASPFSFPLLLLILLSIAGRITH
jgi:ankyrin repeat protein